MIGEDLAVDVVETAMTTAVKNANTPFEWSLLVLLILVIGVLVFISYHLFVLKNNHAKHLAEDHKVIKDQNNTLAVGIHAIMCKLDLTEQANALFKEYIKSTP